jgi:hypothetical protein
MHSQSALVCAVLFGSLPVQAHDIYLQLKDEKGRSCCSNVDCKPVHYRQSSRGVKVFVDGRRIEVPNGRSNTVRCRGTPVRQTEDISVVQPTISTERTLLRM